MTRAAVEKVIVSSGPSPSQGLVNRSVTAETMLLGTMSVHSRMASKTTLMGMIRPSNVTIGSVTSLSHSSKA